MTDEPKNQPEFADKKPDQPEVPGVPPGPEQKPGEPVPPERGKPGEKPKTAVKEPAKKTVEKKQPSFGRRLLRWVIYALIFFGLGALTVYYFFLFPARETVSTARGEVQAAEQRNQELQQQINQLEQQNQELQALDEQNQTLQEEVNQAELHSALLSAQVDVLKARLALAQEQPAQADVALNNTIGELDRISSLLPENQSSVVEGLKERLQLARDEMNDNAFAAQSDLEVLFAGLVDLENNLF